MPCTHHPVADDADVHEARSCMSRAGLAAAGRWIDEVRRRLAAKDLEGLCDRDPPEPVLARKSRACDVWSRDDVETAEERVVWPRRFGIEDVEPGRTDVAGIECLDECGLIYEPAAGGVDEDGSRLHQREPVTVDHS